MASQGPEVIKLYDGVSGWESKQQRGQDGEASIRGDQVAIRQEPSPGVLLHGSVIVHDKCTVHFKKLQGRILNVFSIKK